MLPPRTRDHEPTQARLITDGLAAGPAQVKETVAAFADIGADELILNPTVGDPEETTRLADIVLG
jgi:hypothetical protein